MAAQKPGPKRIDATAAQRQARRTARLAAQGLVRRALIYPADRDAEMVAVAERMTREHLAAIAADALRDD